MHRLVVVLLVLSLAALHWLAGSEDAPVEATPGSGIAAIPPRAGVLSAGQSYAVALDTAGVVHGWGGASAWGNAFSLTPGARPAPVADGSGYRFVSAGNDSILLIDAEGGLRRLGLKDVSEGRRTPVRLFAPRRFALAHESWYVGIAIDREGGLWSWDDLALSDQLKDGGPAVEARRFQPGTRFVDACLQATRLHAVDDAGRLWRSQELRRTGYRAGQPLQGARDTLEPVAADARLRHVRCRENAGQVLALDDQGRLWGYGRGIFGEIGFGVDDRDEGTAYDAPALKPIDSGAVRFAELAVTKGASFAIATDGSLWGFGRNMDHELGLREGSAFHRPTPIAAGRAWVAVAGTFGGGIGLAVDGTLHAWGLNAMGVLGDGGVARWQQTPQPVLTDARFGGRE
jgi:alpha-tubulin suppressor-like RCC1 family protein